MKSKTFSRKYRSAFIEAGSIVSTQSKIISNLAKKLGKSEKATYLQVKRIFFGGKENQETAVNPKNVESPPETLEHDVENSGKGERNLRKRQKKSAKVENSENSENSEHSDKSTPAVPSGVSGTFTQTFDVEEKSIFEIVTGKVKHRKKIIDKPAVKSGWASKLAFFLFKKAEIYCKFDFKNIWTTKDERIHTLGKCECGGEVKILYCSGRLCVNAKNISNEFDHKRSYQIRGEFKKEVLRKLEHRNAQAVRMEVVNELIPNDTEVISKFNPHIRNQGAYRAAKCRANQKTTDPMEVLLEWKDSKYREVIFAVGHSPFFVFYRTALQLSWYIVESKKGPICITLDATGSVIIPPSRSQRRDGSEKLKHVFFYTIMAKTSGKSVPIAQMVSQDQSSEFIALFLRKIFKNLHQPREIICDESKAILKALAQTFAGYENIENYVNACMSAHLNDTKPPPCYIRIDRSHFVKNLTRKLNIGICTNKG